MKIEHCLKFTLLSSFLFACGSSGNTGQSPDADGTVTGPCQFESSFFPYKAGYKWTFKVANLSTGNTSTKKQEVKAVNDAELGDILEQTTSKTSGTTVSAIQVDNNTVLRLRQKDYKKGGSLERTSFYEPGQSRFNSNADKLMKGAKWQELYSVRITDAAGTQISETNRTDEWEVLGTDVDCKSALGEFKCIHLRKKRIVGGVTEKEYFYAKGIGKIKERNSNQIEELVSCGK